MLRGVLTHTKARGSLIGFIVLGLLGVVWAFVAWNTGATWAWALLIVHGVAAMVAALAVGAWVLTSVKLAVDFHRTTTLALLRDVEERLHSDLDDVRKIGDGIDSRLQKALGEERQRSEKGLDELHTRVQQELRDGVATLHESLNEMRSFVSGSITALEGRISVALEDRGKADQSRFEEGLSQARSDLAKIEEGLLRSLEIATLVEKESEAQQLRVASIESGQRDLTRVLQRAKDDSAERSQDLEEQLSRLQSRFAQVEDELQQTRETETRVRKLSETWEARSSAAESELAEAAKRSRLAEEEALRRHETLERRLAEELAPWNARWTQMESRVDSLDQYRREVNLLEGELRHQLASAQSELSDRLAKAEGRLSQQQKSWNRALSSERSRRIVSFARRDGSSRALRRVLLIICPNRSGSTWLFDMLRCHPLVRVEPTYSIFDALRLTASANRYPGALTDAEEGIEIELRRGVGATIPRLDIELESFSEVDTKESEELSIEKVHPEFFDWNASQFVRRLARLERELDRPVELIYRLRDPRESMISMWRYKQRDPNWYSSLDLEQIPNFFARTFEALEELGRLRRGRVVDYQDHLDRPVKTAVEIFEWLWPRIPQPTHEAVAARAQLLTDRELWRLRRRSEFFAPETEDAAEAARRDAEIEGWLGGFREAVDRCSRAYEALLRQASTAASRDRGGKPHPGPSRLGISS